MDTTKLSTVSDDEEEKKKVNLYIPPMPTFSPDIPADVPEISSDMMNKLENAFSGENLAKEPKQVTSSFNKNQLIE